MDVDLYILDLGTRWRLVIASHPSHFAPWNGKVDPIDGPDAVEYRRILLLPATVYRAILNYSDGKKFVYF
jgi:hypothetical protein